MRRNKEARSCGKERFRWLWLITGFAQEPLIFYFPRSEKKNPLSNSARTKSLGKGTRRSNRRSRERNEFQSVCEPRGTRGIQRPRRRLSRNCETAFNGLSVDDQVGDCSYFQGKHFRHTRDPEMSSRSSIVSVPELFRTSPGAV